MLYLILFIITILIVYYFVNFRYLLPKKKVNDIPIKNILIGLPTIDRDVHLSPLIYKALKEATEDLQDINFSLLSIMRKQDTESYNFWKDKSSIITIDNYQINKRHNFDKMSYIFNIIKEEARNYDALMYLESDILINRDSIKKLVDSLKFSHVSLFPFETPWAGYPVIVKDDIFYKIENSRNLKKDQYILGHGTGCMLLNKQVIEDKNIKFDKKEIFGINGQDVGFFDNLNKHGYKTWLVNEELTHLYNH